MASTAIPSTSFVSAANMAMPATAAPNALLARAAAATTAIPAAAPVLSPAAAAPIAAAVGAPSAASVPAQRVTKRPRTKSPDEAANTAATSAEPKAKARAKEVKKPAAAAPAITGEEASGVTPAATEETATSGKDWLIVAKSVRAMLKGMPNGMHCGADALPMLNTRVQEMLTEAASRASGNSRKTLKACDF